MLLQTIVENSNYVTDEQLTESNYVGMANSAIAEVNAKCSTNLPLFTSNNVSEVEYKALKGTWCLRIIEPYFSYSIASNDTDTNSRDFHYNRFLQALNDLENNIDSAILEKDPNTGEDTGYKGDSSKRAIMTIEDMNFNWWGW